MLPSTHDIEFITPLFSKGMYEDIAEIRPPSIRGQLHLWFRAMGHAHANEKAIFGGVHGDPVASRVVVRVSGVRGNTDRRDTLPHKHGGEASPKISYLPGTRFTLHLLPRLGGLHAEHQQWFDATLEAWLLMGSLGLRTTRGAGSFRWQPGTGAGGTLAQPPQTFAAYEQRCQALLASAPTRFALLKEEYTSAEAARRDCSDTIGGRDDRRSQDDLSMLNDPLGRIHGGRKTSPLRFRVVGLEGRFRIAALWDTRIDVTDNSLSDLQGAIRLLVAKDKPVGHQLAASELAK